MLGRQIEVYATTITQLSEPKRSHVGTKIS